MSGTKYLTAKKIGDGSPTLPRGNCFNTEKFSNS